MVTNSVIGGSNKFQLMRHPAGETLVKCHDWTSYLQQIFNSLPGITAYHVFRVDSTVPSSIFVRKVSSSPEAMIDIGRNSTSADIKTTFSTEIVPTGLDLDRQWSSMTRFVRTALATWRQT